MHPTAEHVKLEIETTLAEHPVVLYMKGDPDQPCCGFSKKAVDLLRASGVSSFAHVNVLEKPEIRRYLPEYANWPTFPQLYVHGELIGGCDIMSQLFEQGALQRLLG